VAEVTSGSRKKRVKAGLPERLGPKISTSCIPRPGKCKRVLRMRGGGFLSRQLRPPPRHRHQEVESMYCYYITSERMKRHRSQREWACGSLRRSLFCAVNRRQKCKDLETLNQGISASELQRSKAHKLVNGNRFVKPQYSDTKFDYKRAFFSCFMSISGSKFSFHGRRSSCRLTGCRRHTRCSQSPANIPKRPQQTTLCALTICRGVLRPNQNALVATGSAPGMTRMILPRTSSSGGQKTSGPSASRASRRDEKSRRSSSGRRSLSSGMIDATSSSMRRAVSTEIGGAVRGRSRGYAGFFYMRIIAPHEIFDSFINYSPTAIYIY
jgi:hypothetical protein